jgi:hypothetical protein
MLIDAAFYLRGGRTGHPGFPVAKDVKSEAPLAGDLADAIPRLVLRFIGQSECAVMNPDAVIRRQDRVRRSGLLR